MIPIIILICITLSCALSIDLPFSRAPYKSSIYGTGKSGTLVYFTMGAIMSQTSVDENGQWRYVIDPQPASLTPHKIIIRPDSEDNPVVLENILFGDVFICSGQSNMEITIRDVFNATETFEDVKINEYPIRVRTVQKNCQPNNTIDDLLDKYKQDWSILTPEALGSNLTQGYYYFSAVCYYYGLNLYKSLGIPIGLIATSWGGTSAEVWTPKPALSKCSDLYVGVEEPNSKHGSLWNGMVNPLKKFTIKGVVWYQAEMNMNHHGDYTKNSGYECVFPVLIEQWRKEFSENSGTDPNFPFGFVQLAGYCGTNNHKCGTGPNVQAMRNAQTISYGYAPNPILNNTFFAVSVDLPDPIEPPSSLGDIHPRNKIDVGYRLGHAALGTIYNKHQLTITGPLVESCENQDIYLIIIINTNSYKNEDLILMDEIGFEVLDSDNTWKAAPINSFKVNMIKLSLNNITSPRAVRYLWKANPCCPDAYTAKTPFTCPMKQCGIYTTKSKLPMPPFNYVIENNKCVIKK